MVDGPPLTGLTAAMAVFANMLGPSMNKLTEAITDVNACSLNFTSTLSLSFCSFTPFSHQKWLFAYVSQLLHVVLAGFLFSGLVLAFLFNWIFFNSPLKSSEPYCSIKSVWVSMCFVSIFTQNNCFRLTLSQFQHDFSIPFLVKGL